MTHPKASMCRVCAHRDKDCSKLPFDAMPVIDRYQGGVVVRCLEFKRIATNPTTLNKNK